MRTEKNRAAKGGLLARLGRKKQRGTDLAEKIPFDPEKQAAVLRSSICTGEKVAGFKDLEGGHFTEVMLIRSPADEQTFREIYGLESVKKEY